MWMAEHAPFFVCPVRQFVKLIHAENYYYNIVFSKKDKWYLVYIYTFSFHKGSIFYFSVLCY